MPGNVLQRRQLLFHRPFSNDSNHRFHRADLVIGIA